MPTSLPILVPMFCGLAIALGGCAPAWFEADADREVEALLSNWDNRLLGDREETVLRPDPLPEGADLTTFDDDVAAGPPVVLDLDSSLAQAFTTSRDLETQRESLYLAGLSYSLVRYNFGPIMNATIGYLWQDGENQLGDDGFNGNFGVSNVLSSGGVLAFDATAVGNRRGEPDLSFDDLFFDSSVEVNLRQPLLRGSGYEVSHEALTQSERNLIYAVRDFELFRQDFAIVVASAYYRLVSQKQRLANDEQNYEDAVFDREKAEALRQVDRNQDEQVFLARRREILAEDALLVSRTNLELALDDFKILLGLPTSQPIDIASGDPPFNEVRLDPRSAVVVAQTNRLDLHTQRDQLEDDARRVRIAADGLRADLDLTGRLGFDGGDDSFEKAVPDEWFASVGVELDLPVDRKAERNAYRRALIDVDRSRRDLEERLDVIERDILDQLRSLTQIEKRIELQQDQVQEEVRAVAVTEIRFESGNVEARDLLDARQSLNDASNALIGLKVDHFIARLRLMRDLGIFFVDDEGRWRE